MTSASKRYLFTLVASPIFGGPSQEPWGLAAPHDTAEHAVRRPTQACITWSRTIHPLQAEMRERLAKDKGATYTYSTDYVSQTVSMVDESRVKEDQEVRLQCSTRGCILTCSVLLFSAGEQATPQTIWRSHTHHKRSWFPSSKDINQHAVAIARNGRATKDKTLPETKKESVRLSTTSISTSSAHRFRFY